MSAAHTPGPWTAGINDVPYAELDFECWTVDGPEGGICTVDCGVDDREGIARLIAAAPELLEALEQISAEYANQNLSHRDFRIGARLIADAAIAKARGGGMTLIRTIEIDDITPDELAALFADMDGQQQAAFFTRVGLIAATWPGAGWCQQACAISEHLDKVGKETILKLSEWAAEPYRFPVSA